MDFVDSFLEWVHNEPDSPLTDTPDVYLESVALMTIASIARRSFYLEYGPKKLYPNLWCVLVGKSSFYRKSTSISLGVRLINKVDKKLLLPNEFSMEELIEILHYNSQGLFVIDEFETFIKQFGRSYMRGGLSLINQLYDREIPYVRKLREVEYRIDNPFINMISATTLSGFEQSISESEVRSGFLPRFFFVIATKKDRQVEIPGASNIKKENDLVAHLSGLRTQAGRLMLSSESSEIYKEFYHKILEEWKYDLRNGVSPFITRLLTSCLKFAMTYHLATTFTPIIQKESMQKAIKYTEVLMHNVRKLFSLVAFTQYQQQRRAVIMVFVKYDGWVTKSRLLRELRYPKNQLNTILESLLEEDTIIIKKEPSSSTGGKPTTKYKLTDEGKQWEGTSV